MPVVLQKVLVFHSCFFQKWPRINHWEHWKSIYSLGILSGWNATCDEEEGKQCKSAWGQGAFIIIYHIEHVNHFQEDLKLRMAAAWRYASQLLGGGAELAASKVCYLIFQCLDKCCIIPFFRVCHLTWTVTVCSVLTLSGKGCIVFHAIFHNSWVGELCYDTVRLDLMINNDAWCTTL